MIPAILSTLSDGTIVIGHEDTFARKSSTYRLSILANLRGRRLEVIAAANGSSLWYYNDFQSAEEWDEPTGQVYAAIGVEACVRWIKAFTARGPDQDRMLEHFSHWHFPTFWKQRQEYRAKEFAQWEADQDESARLWYAREEDRLNAEAKELEEASEFPVETNLENLQ